MGIDAEILLPEGVNLCKNPDNVGESVLLSPVDSLAYLSSPISQQSEPNQQWWVHLKKKEFF